MFQLGYVSHELAAVRRHVSFFLGCRVEAQGSSEDCHGLCWHCMTPWHLHVVTVFLSHKPTSHMALQRLKRCITWDLISGPMTCQPERGRIKMGVLDGKQQDVVSSLHACFKHASHFAVSRWCYLHTCSPNSHGPGVQTHHAWHSLGSLKMLLPASAFTTCSAAKYPMNTLFGNVDSQNVTFEDMQYYFPLMLKLADTSPEGF